MGPAFSSSSRSPILILLLLLLLPVMGFQCYTIDPPDPCNPPCGDNDAVLNVMTGDQVVGCNCSCDRKLLQMQVSFFDAATNTSLTNVTFSNVTTDQIYTTNPRVPTCTEMRVRIRFKCSQFNSLCTPDAPYIDQWFTVPRIPCGDQYTINLVPIACAYSV